MCWFFSKPLVSIFNTVRLTIFLVPGSCILYNSNVAFQGECTIVLIFDIFRERNLAIIDYQRERIIFLQYLRSYNSFSSFFFLPSLMMRWIKNSTTSELPMLICSVGYMKKRGQWGEAEVRSPECYPPSAVPILEDSVSREFGAPCESWGRKTGKQD